MSVDNNVLLSVCIINIKCAVTDHQQILKEAMWLVTRLCIYELWSNLWTEEPAMKFLSLLTVTLTLTLSLANEISIILLCDCCYLTVPCHLKSTYTTTVRNKDCCVCVHLFPFLHEIAWTSSILFSAASLALRTMLNT